MLCVLLSCITLFTQCHSTKWNKINADSPQNEAPSSIKKIFASYPNAVMTLSCKNPAYNYKYDIGEKDELYGSDSLILRFRTVEIRLKEKMPVGNVLADFVFIDGKNNKVHVDNVDLLRWALRLNAPDNLLPAETLLEEYNRFGFTFRKEHQEFKMTLAEGASEKLIAAEKRAYRCQIVNNCLAPTKWEFSLVSEEYSDFGKRMKAKTNLNQNKILSHSWFYLDKNLYLELLKLKNPHRKILSEERYDSLSNRAERELVAFEQLRRPIKNRAKTKMLEVGHKSGRQIEPVDVEEFYKREFKLVLSERNLTYSSVLENPVKTTRFKEEGFYREDTPNEFDFSWMKHVDDVSIDIVDVKGSDVYSEIVFKGKWSPYEIHLGNVDLSLISEQKLYGFLFGFNTYPKSRRYNPVQNTIAYDTDLLPEDRIPYLLMVDSKTGKWVNNQYKGVEKIYLTYESLERDVLVLYVLSYERITPIWMARIKLPQDLRQKIRIRKGLYNY